MKQKLAGQETREGESPLAGAGAGAGMDTIMALAHAAFSFSVDTCFLLARCLNDDL